MKFANRFLLPLCLLVGAAAPPALAPRPAAAQDLPLQIGTAAIPFNRTDPGDRQVGRLLWRGGIVFSASAPEFGGWSDLNVSRDGGVLAAVSEEATWFTATVDYDAEGDLAGLRDARIGPLHGLNGKPIVGRGWTTAEALAQLGDGSWVVAFERNHRIWRYTALGATPVQIDGPAEIARQPLNAGIKAMTARPDGRIIAISEDYSLQPGTVVGWIGKPAGGTRYTWQSFNYTVGPDFRPTAMAALPDGSFATLERAFDVRRGARSRLMHLPASHLEAGATAKGEELAMLAPPYPVDNYEGLSATRGRRGETLLWVNSNDNFNPLQRNLLLLFELRGSP
jgi:hypothetical protein